MSKAPLMQEDTKITPLQMHQKNFTFLNRVETGKNQASEKLVKESYDSICNGFKDALVCANASSAPYVAYLYANGFGCKKDLKKAAIWLEIGAQLRDPNSLSLKNGYNPSPDDVYITNLRDILDKHHQIFTPEARGIASQYVRAIEKSIEQHGGMNTPMDTVIVTACDMRFEHALHPKETILHVIGDDDGSSCCCTIM